MQGVGRPSSWSQCLSRALKHEWYEELLHFPISIWCRVLLACAVLMHFQTPEPVIHEELVLIVWGNASCLILSNVLHSSIWHPALMCLILLWEFKNKMYKFNLFRSWSPSPPKGLTGNTELFLSANRVPLELPCVLFQPCDRKNKASGEDNFLWVVEDR